VRFSVTDTGIGVEPAKHEQIFAEFEQADSSTTRVHGGTGLGLSISRRIVRLLGGELEVESDLGRGSDFHFVLTLPRAGTPPHERQAPAVSLEGRRFLVVDDNATARRIVREALSMEGAQVEEASTPDAGLALLRSAGEGFAFDCVVVDHQMPGKDGFMFVEEVSDHAQAPPRVLMLTSSPAAAGKAMARSVGIGAYLAKPVSRRDLIRALRSLLGGDGSGQGERRLITNETLALEPVSLRILLAEDNVVNQQVAVAFLKKRGYEVDVVDTGQKAVDAVLETPYDVVLMDVRMPEMDGFEATRRIRAHEHLATLPVIALTAHALQEERERAREAGMNDFVTKPFMPEPLYEVIERWAGPKGGAATPPRSSGEAPAEDAAAAAPVDVTGFREAMRAAGVEEVVDAALDLFVAEAPRLFESIELAMGAADLDGVMVAAHTLKSSSGSIRATRLAEGLQRLEAAARAGDGGSCAAQLDGLRVQYKMVMDYLASVA
jgi:CheY-like chemotaxis protein/HPt (histidine-containing phosphotransfer) domain-containing protein